MEAEGGSATCLRSHNAFEGRIKVSTCLTSNPTFLSSTTAKWEILPLLANSLLLSLPACHHLPLRAEGSKNQHWRNLYAAGAPSLFVSLQFGRRQWYPTPVLLPGKSHGWRSLVGYSPWGCKESDTTERLHFTHFILYHWRRKWQPTPVFLPGESQGRGSPVDSRLWGHTESDTTEVT